MPETAIRHNPYTIFHASRTPPGLYARQKWLNQDDTDAWRTDFTATVAELKSIGSEEPEWHTFLVVHALRNKGLV